MGDLDTILLAVSALVIIVLATMKGILNAFPSDEVLNKAMPEPPKPDGISDAAHKAIDVKNKEEQGEIKSAVDGTDPGKDLANLVNQRNR